MPSTSTTLSLYESIAEQTQGDTPWLGQIVTYSVSETSMPHAILEARLRAVGLEDHLPKRPHDADVFRRVCTNAQRQNVPTGSPDVFVNILVRNVGTKD